MADVVVVPQVKPVQPALRFLRIIPGVLLLAAAAKKLKRRHAAAPEGQRSGDAMNGHKDKDEPWDKLVNAGKFNWRRRIAKTDLRIGAGPSGGQAVSSLRTLSRNGATQACSAARM